jgi:ligand-binding sensor domain-containing protein
MTFALTALSACTSAPDSAATKDTALDTAETGGDRETGESGDTAESGETGEETGDETGDSGGPLTVTTYAVPTAAWSGLSVGSDGAVWGATDLGLVRMLPATGQLDTWTSAHGLTTDSPTAVLAASNGTVWVGHVYDESRQGEQVLVDGGELFVLQPIDYTATTEITGVYRLREQPYGVGVGDIWMGANEGINLYDEDLNVFEEHAHPTHPHGNTLGVAFTPDGHQWNLDQNQVSRYAYSNDGDLSPSTDLVEFWQAWPVELEASIGGTDADADGWTVWLSSSLYGVARIDVGKETGTSTTTFYAAPLTANAVRVGPDGTVWVGAADGLYRLEGDNFVLEPAAPSGAVSQLAAADDGVWAVIDSTLVLLSGVP